jgi:hypothetical protein
MATKSKSRSTSTGVATPEAGTLPAAPAPQATAGDRQVLIAEAAFYIAQSRGFGPGGELGDWLAAERLIEERLTQAVGAALVDNAGTAAAAAEPVAELVVEPVVEPAAVEPAPAPPRKRAAKTTAAANVPVKGTPAAPAKKTAPRRAK